MLRLLLVILLSTSIVAEAAIHKRWTPKKTKQNPYFDIPVTYNNKVKYWIKQFRGPRKYGFNIWLNRSHRYLPKMQNVLKYKGLPKDLAYIAIIESGLTSDAVSHANAVGYWQFIEGTGNRFGLKKAWWIDERHDFFKSTEAAANYLSSLYKMFGSWYLTAAAYNMGENRLKRLIKKHKTKNFWILSKKRDFPKETREYIPKLLATLMIAKAPKLYGFNKVKPLKPYKYEYFYVPGGTDLINLANFMGFTKDFFLRLNPAILKGFIPKSEPGYWIRIPKGHTANASLFLRNKIASENRKKQTRSHFALRRNDRTSSVQ